MTKLWAALNNEVPWDSSQSVATGVFLSSEVTNENSKLTDRKPDIIHIYSHNSKVSHIFLSSTHADTVPKLNLSKMWNSIEL